MKYSVLMSVYALENAENLRQSLESMLNQTLPPDEIVLIKDGPLTPELEAVIRETAQDSQGVLCTYELPTNSGLGAALNYGLERCSNEIIARMDSDDISYPDRMEKQLDFLGKHPEVDVLSGAISEFDDDPKQVTGTRWVPETHAEIARFALTRCPFNHMAVVYKKSAVLKAGAYREDLRRVEDHDLWMRMLRAGSIMANLRDPIVYARCSDAMHKKRHGMENARALRKFYREMYLLGEVGYAHYAANVFFACGLQLMPTWLHKACYRLLRSSKQPIGMKLSPAQLRKPIPRGERVLYTPSEEESAGNREHILQIFDDVQAVCKKHGLTLLLSGGSCLGAVRHGGFIPWDDDMDAVMPRRDYETLKSVFDEELGSRYTLEVPSCPGHSASHLFMKVILRDGPERTQITHVGAPAAKGPWLDIVPLENAPADPFKRICKGIACDVIAYLAVSRYLYTFRNRVTSAYWSGSFGRRTRYVLRNALGFLAGFLSWEKWYELFDRFSQCNEDSGIVTFPAGIRHYLGESHPVDDILPGYDGEFEGRSVKLPHRAHVYLRQLYGADYLMLPPEDRRVRHKFVKPEYEGEAR